MSSRRDLQPLGQLTGLEELLGRSDDGTVESTSIASPSLVEAAGVEPFDLDAPTAEGVLSC